jgi:hypothetical protein
VTCTEVNSYLARPREDSAALPEAVQKHLRKCAPCRSLRDFLTGREVLQQGPAARTAKIQEEILGSLRPVEPLPGTGKLVRIFLLVFAVYTGILIGLAELYGAHGSGNARPLPFISLLGAIGVVVFLVAVVLSREMAPGERRWLPAIGQLAVMLGGLLAVVALLFRWQVERNFWGHSWECFRAGLLMSVPLAGLIIAVLRRGAVLWLCAAGAASGLFAGLSAMTLLHFACATYDAPHIALAHWGVPLAGMLIGFVLGRILPFLPGGFGSVRAGG